MLYNKHTQSGFTLMEILIALAIFIVGIAGIWGLYWAALQSHQRALDEQRIAWLAQSTMAELKATDLNLQYPLSNIIHAQSQIFPDYNYDVMFQDMGHNAVLVELKIYYQRRGKIRTQTFYTIVYRSLSKQIPQEKR